MSLFTNEFEQDISRTRFVGWSHPTRLVITALDFHLHFNRSTGDQVWREEPLAYRIFASFVGVGRPGDSMSAQNVPVLPNHDFHDYPKMLIPQRCRPFRTTHLNRPHAYTRYSVTKWADRIGGGVKSSVSALGMSSMVSTRNLRYGLPPSVTSTSRARLRPWNWKMWL